MVREGRYSNVITTADIDAAGDSLYASVFSEQVLSDGQAANLSFRHLVDADILVVQRQGIDQKISFKYERFYEYFIGKRIVNLGEVQRDLCAFFLNLIEEIAHTPFLWGAVKNALAQEAKKLRSETILKLCRTVQQRVKEMMVSVLTQLGLDSPEIVEEILKKLIPQEKKATEWRKGQWLLGESSQTSDMVSRNAGRTAIEVASNLGMCEFLQRGALYADPSLRTESVRHSYILWQRDPIRGFVILEELTRQAIRGLLPNILAFESVLGLSAAIFFDHYQDKSVLARLQRVWRGIIAALLHVRAGRSYPERVIRAFLRERIFSLVYSTAFRLLHESPSNDIFDLRELEAFFRASEEEKALYQRLVQYIDVYGTYAREQMEYDYHQAIKRDNLLFLLVTDMGLIAHMYHAPLSFLPFVRSLFYEAKIAPVSDYLGQITNILENVLSRSILNGAPELDEVFDFFVKAAETSQEHYTHYPSLFRLQVQTHEPAETLGELIGQNAWYFLRDEVILESPELRSLLLQIFDKAPDCKNLHTWLDYFIRQIVNCIYGEEVLRQSVE